jgi:hypothetical protein
MALYTTELSATYDIKKQKDQLQCYGTKWMSEGPFQVTDTERVKISTTGHCLVQAVYNSAFWRKAHGWI